MFSFIEVIDYLRIYEVEANNCFKLIWFIVLCIISENVKQIYTVYIIFLDSLYYMLMPQSRLFTNIIKLLIPNIY